MNPLIRHARRLIVTIVGGTVLLFGLILLVTPGPAFVVIPIGLAILATEFVWARNLLHRVKDQAQSAMRGDWRGKGEAGNADAQKDDSHGKD